MGIRRFGAERSREPGPHLGVIARADDLARGVELVGYDVVDRNGRAAGPEGGNRDIPEPYGLLDQIPRAVVFAAEVTGMVVDVEEGPRGGRYPRGRSPRSSARVHYR